MSHDQTAPGHVADPNRPKIFRPGDDATAPPPAAEDAATAARARSAQSWPPVPPRPPSPVPGFHTPAPSYSAQQQQNSIPDPGYRNPSPPAATGQGPVVAWLVDPANRKTVIAGGALVLAGLVILAGSGVTRLAGVVAAVAIWAAFFRVAHTEKGTFRMWTRLDAEEIAGLAAEECMNLSGPLSKVVLPDGSIDRLNFVVTGAMSSPLEFHADMVRHTDGRTCVTTSIDTWTRNRMTVWFIPVPFSKTIDGFGLYKKFGDRWIERLQQYDADATGEYLKNPS
ncbi:hypothetical protein [Mycobacterium sp. PSTR-4-N]|uniref:hypothetical protein n=1 Tax=Mycobacterium sp. PSTR-4-N TaxID=2917745 RepID=UPI001F150ABB|nr:hypothetical protein [Mycobacterium sp. PSTR-4-N]MCG7592744.1 hypothetical protein [Mycobacterium sp. PSTR-4-N]